MKRRREKANEEVAGYIADLQAQIRDLLEEREELLTEIRRLRMGRHPAGRALADDGKFPGRTYHEGNGHAGPGDEIAALAEALTERDAEHEGGAGA